jgi:curved DNA-binding protein CbpA
MNLNSPLFDRIRTRRKAEEASSVPKAGCQHPGCAAAGEYRAPKGRDREGEYFKFCLDHVKEYNASYNYFAGMSDDAVAKYQKESVIGHRPTWGMGVNSAAAKAAAAGATSDHGVYEDPLGLFRAGGFAGRAAPEPERRRGVGPVAKRALDTLDLDENADAVAIKTKFKILVKRFHPDMNGGDRTTEDRLREIIDAYNTLKASGLI